MNPHAQFLAHILSSTLAVIGVAAAVLGIRRCYLEKQFITDAGHRHLTTKTLMFAAMLLAQYFLF